MLAALISTPPLAGSAVAAEPVDVVSRLLSDVPEGAVDVFGDRLVVEAVLRLSADDPAFGGLSGLWIAPDGERMIAASDSGQRWQARLVHDDHGRLVRAEDWSVADFRRRREDGEGSFWQDAEALAPYGENGLALAYEGQHRLRRWSLGDLDAIPERLTLPEGLGGPSNSGIEALASLGSGRLFALAERVGAWGGEGLMGWVIEGRQAEDFVYVPGDGFAPTGAARLDDIIYIVERRFSLLGGFQSRIVTLPVDSIAPGTSLEGDELAAFRWGDIGENFEAIVARHAPDGRILLYLLADDNFSFFQETLLVQLSLSTRGSID